MPLLSVIIPAFNEEEAISVCVEKVVAVMDGMGMPYEIIVADDGSRDGTFGRITELHGRHPQVKGVSLSRNFGHQNALLAGLRYASGDAVIMMDADLQHPPELIPEMVKLWREGSDVVYTVREDNGDISWFKKTSSALFYRLINAVGNVTMEPHAADFRLIDRTIADIFLQLPERSVFFRGLAGWMGFRQTGLRYKAGKRVAGRSKYDLSRMWKLGIDNLFRFSTFPLRLIFTMGFMVLVLAAIYALYVILVWARHGVIQGWSSLLIAVLFFGSLQLISIGIIGRYIEGIFTEVKRRPLYLVRSTVGDLRPRATAEIPSPL